MTLSPATSPGMKRRRREAASAASIRVVAGTSQTEPTREARVGWGDDLPRDFEVLSKIGEGSFGTVWTARRKGGCCQGKGKLGNSSSGSSSNSEEEMEQEEDEEKGLVALKRINPTCSPSRILNEFEQMRKLGGSHNVIRVQGILRTPGGAFALVMPFFEHDDFREITKSLTLSGIAAYTRSLLTALAHVHALGIIHRDIKPRNFMYNAKSGRGLLIDFGLAEPVEKWKDRSEALAEHRRKRARGKKDCPRGRAPLGVANRGASTGRRGGGGGGDGSLGGSSRGGRKGEGGVASSLSEKESRLKLLRKVERGGTTGFRAPEILWHCRDQEPVVDVWSAGVILLCLLSRRYPLFPSADNDEMALVQIAALVGADEIVRAARRSGRCDIVEFPSQRRGSLEELCAPSLGGVQEEARDEEERRARADALSLVQGMLKVDPRERLSAKDALMHAFVVAA